MFRRPIEWLAVAMAVAVCLPIFAEPPISKRDGTLKDMVALKPEANLMRGAFQTPVALDASKLDRVEFALVRSKPIALRPGARYTLAVRYKAQGSGMVSAGVEWVGEKKPAGLTGVDDLRAAFPAAPEGALRALTFQADPKLGSVRILLKAWGGMKAEVQDITLVEGWYAD